MAHAADPPPSRAHPALLAANFLFPAGRRLEPESPLWAAVGRWFILWGLVVGLAYLIVFRVTWKWFGEYQGVRWLPAAAVLALDLGFCGHRLLAGITHLPSRLRAEQSNPLTFGILVAVLLITIAKYAMLLSLPFGQFRSPPTPSCHLPGWILIFCPNDEIYRPLLLMPIWGRWAVGLGTLIGRISPDQPAWLVRIAEGLSLKSIFAQWVAATIITMAYCSLAISSGSVFIASGRTLGYGLVISIGVMVCSYLMSFLLARRGDGQTESSVCVAGLTAELAFLSLYLPFASVIFWY